MTYLKAAASAALIIGASTAAAAAPGGQKQNQAVKELRQAAHVMMTNGDSPPGQSRRPDDPDQGDDNASLRAISEVCTKDTPAAERSAICDGEPVSPY